MSKFRSIKRVIEAPVVTEGEGVSIHRVFPNYELSELDPFLLLDHMGPMDLQPGEAKGFPDHPHCGFETVTYMLEGELRHRDSFGHEGVIGPGDVQWMTAGSGLVHSERPGDDLLKNGGRLHGFQLWINLPRRDKMKAPAYQELPSRKIPAAVSADGTVEAHVIAGEALGVEGVVATHFPIQFVHFKLKSGAALTHAVPRTLNAMVYVIQGEVVINGQLVPRFSMAELGHDADQIQLATVHATEILLLAAEPIREPVVRRGPFVMNSQAELQQAFQDYRAGKMGTIEPVPA